MNILKSDFSKEGYKQGLDDASKSDNSKKGFKYHWNMFKKGFRIINHNQAMKTYSQGYETGHIDGLRKKEELYGNTNNTVKDNHNINTNTMGNNAENLGKQIDLLNSFDNFLSNVQTNLYEIDSIYRKVINELFESGLVAEYANKLKDENYTEFKDEIIKVNQWITDIDKKYTKKVIAQVVDAMENG